MLCESKVRCFYWEFDDIFFLPKGGCKYSRTNSYIFAMTLILQNDNLTAGAWAACDLIPFQSRQHLLSADTNSVYSISQWTRISLFFQIYNGNWTEWSAVWAEIPNMSSDQNCMTRGSITTLLYPFRNRLNTRLGQFKYFIDALLSQFEIKFIHFFGGGGEI